MPLVRIAGVFAAGILFAIYGFLKLPFALSAWLSVALCIGYLALWHFRAKRPLKLVMGVLALAGCFLAGYSLVFLKTESNLPNHLLQVSGKIIAYEATMAGHFDVRQNSYRTTVRVTSVKTDAGWQEVSGKINLYISKKDFDPTQWWWGDAFLVKGSPVEITPPANPHEFDFKRFLGFKNVYHQHFVKAPNLRRVADGHGLMRWSAKIRWWCSTTLERHIPGQQEAAIAKALVIGVTDAIDNDLENAYAASGAMHVLAVSGLHVGIIYGILLLLFKPLGLSQKAKWFVAILSVLVLWGYAFVTGLSPSVLRAVTMFSFMAVAKPLGYRSNIFNTLAGSAFLLMLFDPYLVMSVGFQLSYLAVLGIIWIERPIYLLFAFQNRLVDWIWKTTSISIAAQATTFALGLLYFHQFPTYFLVSNLIVIPASFLILIGGLILLIFSFWGWAAAVVGWVLYWCCWFLNYVVFFVEKLPFSLVNGVFVDVLQCWLFLGLLASGVYFLQQKSIAWIYVATGMAVAIAGARWLHYSQHAVQQKLVVYNVSKQSAVDVLTHHTAYFWADSALCANPDRVRFHIRPNRLFHEVQAIQIDTLTRRSEAFLRTIKLNNKEIWYWSGQSAPTAAQGTPAYLILSKHISWRVKDCAHRFPNTQIVLDSSWPPGQAQWVLRNIPQGTKMHAVGLQGAFVAPL